MTSRAIALKTAEVLAFVLLLAGPAIAQTDACKLLQDRPKSLFEDSIYNVGGYVKLDAIFDFDDAGNRFQFLPPEIPVDGGNGPATTFNARQIFLNLLVTTPTDYGDLDIFVEGDFFGSGNSFRLRHGYGRWGHVLAGQTWSLLVDEDAFIETLDFAGADSGTLLRAPQIRLTIPVSDYVRWKIGMEENLTDTLAPSVAGQIRNRLPTFASGIRFGSAPNHIYCRGAIADATFIPTVGPAQTETVWALGLSSRFSIGAQDSVIGRIIAGDGANSLVTDNSIRPTGLVVPSGQIEALTEHSWSLAYKHYWREDLRSNLVYRRAKADNTPAQASTELRSIQYVATNLIWRPVESVDIGIEYLFGQRENKDRRSADANRLQFSFIWRLP